MAESSRITIAPEKPEAITFTRADQDKLDEIVNFIIAVQSTFDVDGEIGHTVDRSTVAELLQPAVTRANEFSMEITDRFDRVR
jgi:hypothetical protein